MDRLAQSAADFYSLMTIRFRDRMAAAARENFHDGGGARGALVVQFGSVKEAMNADAGDHGLPIFYMGGEDLIDRFAAPHVRKDLASYDPECEYVFVVAFDKEALQFSYVVKPTAPETEQLTDIAPAAALVQRPDDEQVVAAASRLRRYVCASCDKRISSDTAVSCPVCDTVVYCGQSCLKADSEHHASLCAFIVPRHQ